MKKDKIGNSGNKMVLKITSSVWENASRDARELTVVRELGADVLVMAKGEKTGVIDQVKGFDVYRMSTRPLGKGIPNIINRCISVLTWAIKARKLHPDIISGHDLIPLFIGWLSTLFMRKKNKPKLVYDSHEFTIYDEKSSKLAIYLTRILEGFLIKKCFFSIEVSNCIADEVQKIHKLSLRPTVVRNIPNYWNLDNNEIEKTKNHILKLINAPKSAFLIAYHGGIKKNRGIEELLQAASRDSDIFVLLLGDGEDSYIKNIKQDIIRLKIKERVIIHPAVALEDLYKYIGAVDIGFVCIKDASKSLYYCLPNKFFENIQSLTPMIFSDFPEMSALNEQYHVGIAVDPKNPAQVDKAIFKLKNDRSFYERCKANCAVAKDELCWEKECHILEEAYKKII